ncbi:MAG: DUF2764 family protein [Cyclobacteriaceae bacterium]
MSRYYYLVSGLPDLQLDKPVRKINFEEVYLQITENLTPEDREKLNYLVLRNDVVNFLQALSEKRGEASHYLSWQAPALLSPEIIEHFLRNSDSFPVFMQELLHEHPDWLDDRSLKDIESWLWKAYYTNGLEKHEGFIAKYLAFELNLRNILLAYNARNYQINLKEQLIADADINRLLLRSQAADFGLAREYPFMENLQLTFADKDPVKIEKTIDKIKWQYIDELTAFSFFDIDTVLGYFLKMQIVQRWNIYPETENAKTHVKALSEKILEGFKLPEIFN